MTDDTIAADPSSMTTAQAEETAVAAPETPVEPAPESVTPLDAPADATAPVTEPASESTAGEPAASDAGFDEQPHALCHLEAELEFVLAEIGADAKAILAWVASKL